MRQSPILFPNFQCSSYFNRTRSSTMQSWWKILRFRRCLSTSSDIFLFLFSLCWFCFLFSHSAHKDIHWFSSCITWIYRWIDCHCLIVCVCFDNHNMYTFASTTVFGSLNDRESEPPALLSNDDDNRFSFFNFNSGRIIIGVGKEGIFVYNFFFSVTKILFINYSLLYDQSSYLYL